MPGADPNVTIIILTKNGEGYLNEVLARVFAQKIDYPFEVIAIDSGSTDATLSKLARYPIRVERIPAEQFNHGETRNLGAQIARGEFIVFLTQDATPANDQWLQHLITPMQTDTCIAAVCSRQLPRQECNPVVAGHLATTYPLCSTKEEIKHFPPGKRDQQIFRRCITLSNVSAAYRKTTLLRFPFPRTNFAEDAAWEFAALRRGDATMFQPQSVVLHSHTYTMLEWLRRSYVHAWALQQIFSSSATVDGNPWGNLLHNIRTATQNDWRNLDKKNIHGIQRVRWLGYGILWHGAAMVGAVLGARGVKNPTFLHRTLAVPPHQSKKNPKRMAIK